jgi:hypothetical protein
MFTKLINALLGAFGIVKRTKTFTTENNDEFLKSLKSTQIVLTGAYDPNFIQGGIQGATNSFWQHAIIYVGITAANMIRKMYPELLSNPKIPKEAITHEIIEASMDGIVVSSLDKYCTDKSQMCGYSREISTVELIKILHRAYSRVGLPYDVGEFAGDALPNGMQDFIPNNKNLFCCASLAAYSWEPVERICKKEVDITRVVPGELNDYLEPNKNWSQTKYNC